MFKSQGFVPFSNRYAMQQREPQMKFQQMRKVNEQDGAGDSSENVLDKKKLIVNYIPQFATEEELASIFTQIGPIENIRIMRDHKTGYSFGFGFVQYTNAEDAAQAIETVNGLTYRNKRLKVSYSRPPGHDMKDSNLYITNLPRQFTESDVDDLFGAFGEIVQRNILKDKITGMPRGVAFVRFSKGNEAQAAIEGLDGKQLDNSLLPLNVRVAEDHGRKKAQYLEYVNHMYMCNNNRGFTVFRGCAMPFRDIPMPRGQVPLRRNRPANFNTNRFLGMGAGDTMYQHSVFF